MNVGMLMYNWNLPMDLPRRGGGIACPSDQADNSWSANHIGKDEDDVPGWTCPTSKTPTAESANKIYTVSTDRPATEEQRQSGCHNQGGPWRTKPRVARCNLFCQISLASILPELQGKHFWPSVWASTSLRIVHDIQIYANSRVKLSFTSLRCGGG